MGTSQPKAHPSRILVRFRHGAPRAFLAGSGPAAGFPGDPDLYLIQNPPGLSVADAVRNYHSDAGVAFAEPDFLVQAVGIPNDPLWSQQWDMAKISAPIAWNTQTNAGDVVVGIIDTGINFTHPDLQANIWTNPTDGSHGFTCLNGTCAAGGLDDYGHGTHVAGAIGAAGNNGAGISGINWKVQLLSVKFMDSNGNGYVSDAILGLDQLTALKAQGVNVRVTNNSWGGPGFSQALQNAMARGEAAGILHICAAGNNGQNTDVFPIYPADFTDRGIISVLASDTNDIAAGFSNFGLSSVDIAAPGVNTLSTVPTGACTYCDPSGYLSLSGTSMAAPHVSGVVAALAHLNPGITQNQLRDVVLDPASYDSLTDPTALATSTGGRLNFAKSLANPLLASPRLNSFPTLSMGVDLTFSSGSPIVLTATATDLDHDPLRFAWANTANQSSLWLFGWMMNLLFPTGTGSSLSFTAPPLARTATVPYYASVADGRGGAVTAVQNVTVLPLSNPGQPPSGTLSASPASAPLGSTIAVNFPLTDPQGGTTGWDLWVGMHSGVTGYCCFGGPSTALTFSTAGAYRISAQAIDNQLNLSARQSVVVLIGGAANLPPLAKATLDKLSGPAPLTVNIDMSASSDPDGSISYYFFNCGGGTLTQGAQTSAGTCTFNTPGGYWLMLQVEDNSGNMDSVSAYVTVTPGSSSAGTAPPVVALTGPASGATVSGTISIAASASAGAGISKVDFYRDSGVLLGTATSAPYTVSWNSASASNGTHVLYAAATDTLGRVAQSGQPSILVNNIASTPPAVSIVSPANGSTLNLKGKSTTIQASPTQGTYPISRVDILANSAVICSDKAVPYTCTWKPATTGTYTIQANAYDTNGGIGRSAPVSVTVK